MSACYVCGVQTDTPDVITLEPLMVEGRRDGRYPRAMPTVDLGKCPTCTERHELVERMLDADPGGVSRIGARVIAADRVACALDALALAGISMPKPGEPIGALTECLTDVGAEERWAYRYAPMWTKGARADEHNSKPWEHVTDLQPTRNAIAQLMAQRFARTQPPKLVPPPSPSVACMFCGVSSAEVSALRVAQLGGLERASERLWREIEAGGQTVGLSTGTKRVQGHLCPLCTRAVDDAGGIGRTAMEKSLTAHLRAAGERRRGDLIKVQTKEFEDLRAWVTLPRNTRPNPEPWEHLTFV